MRPCKARQRGDLSRMVHADLGHAERGLLGQAGQRQRQAPVIVVRGDGGVRFAERRENAAQHLLGRGLADAAGDCDDLAAEPVAPGAAQPRQRRQGVVNLQQRRGSIDPGQRPVHHGAGRALGERLGNMGMAVAGFSAVFAAQRNE